MQRYLLNTILIALVLFVSALAVQWFTTWQWEGIRVYLLLIIMAAVLALLFRVRFKKTFRGELMALEKRLNLKELLSTWYEYRRSEPENPWTLKLEAETRSFFQKIPPSGAFPKSYTLTHLLIPLLVVLGILLMIIEPLSFKADKPLDSSLLRLGTRLERAVDRMAKTDQSPEQVDREWAEKIEELAQKLKKQDIKREDLFRSVNEMKLKIEKDNSLVSRQIEEELGFQDVSDKGGVRQGGKSEKRSEEFEQLEKQLEEVFQREVPVTLTRRIQSLRRSLELEELLTEVSDEIGAGFAPLGKEGSEEDLGESGQGSASGKKKDQNFSGQSTASEDSEKTSDRQASEDIGAPGRKGPGEKGGSREEEEMMEGFQAGQGTSSAKADEPTDVGGKRGPVLTERHDVEAGDSLIIYVKSLPIAQRSEVRPEEALRSYRREFEAVLDKEDIPITDRQAIRNYFMSIGLRKENNERENN